MAKGRTAGTWTKGQGGKPKGARDKVARSFKRALEDVYAEVSETHPAVIRRALLRGLKAAPPKSSAYLTLWSHYTLGKPVERVLFADATSLFTIRDDELPAVK